MLVSSADFKENIIVQVVQEMLISQEQYKYVSVWRLDDSAVFVVKVLLLHGIYTVMMQVSASS